MATISGLHLQYRLWIANLNADIDVLRILNDYTVDKLATDQGGDIHSRIEYFKQLFLKLRQEIDDLRHEMHLNKMKLGAFSNEVKQSTTAIEKSINHEALKERYNAFRELFIKTKKEFQDFENGRGEG